MSIIERIRWTNVAKLGLAIAAGVLIAGGAPGGRPRGQAVPLPRAVAPAPSTVDRRPSTDPPRAELPRPRHHRHGRRRTLPAAPPAAPRGQPTADSRLAPPAPTPVAPPPQPRARAGGGASEFF